MLKRGLGLLALCVTLVGCASTQLNFNTLEIASTVASLETKQVLANISAFIDDPDIVPAQVTIASGSIGTTNSVTPTVVESLTKTNSVLGALSATRTVIQSATEAGTNQATQSWAVLPVNDGDELRRLQALYLFAATGNHHALTSYPQHQILVSQTGGKVSRKPDPLLEDERHKISSENPKLCNDWLYYSGKSWSGVERPVPEGQVAIPLGLYGNHELYTTVYAKERQCLSNFVMFVEDAAGATASPASATAGPKAGTPGGRSNGQILSAPYSGPVFTPDAVPPAAR